MTGRDLLRIVGLDPGETKVHLCIGQGGQPQGFRFLELAADPGDPIEQADDLACMVVEQLQPLADEVGRSNVVLLVESPAFTRANRAHQLGGVHTTLLLAAQRAGFASGHAHLGKVKKLVTGSGNAGKPLVVSSLAARTGLTFRSHDAADAFAVWCYGMAVADRQTPLGQLPRRHIEALEGQTLPALLERFRS